MKRSINILGTNYRLVVDSKSLEPDTDGLCGYYNKQITMRGVNDIFDKDTTVEEKKLRFKEIMRHELVHAFLSESGLDNYSSDEVLVQWMAAQLPKMFEVMKECECI